MNSFSDIGSLWLHRFAVLTAAATLLLLAAGGLVTSHGVGMAVPDWPNTYGYNMFLFPVSQWVGGIFYEHSHRLVAAFVGLLTTILAGWLWARETGGRARWLGIATIATVIVLMGVRKLPVYVALAGLSVGVIAAGLAQFKRDPNGLRWLGVVALAAVIFQGVLGGLRVVWLADEIGIFHATLAQLFFVLMCAIALMTSKWWKRPSPLTPHPSDGSLDGLSSVRQNGNQTPTPHPDPLPIRWGEGVRRTGEGHYQRRGEQSSSAVGKIRGLVLATTLLILGQLILGATMRHQHAGLAIPDFPLAYGKLWPAMDADSVARYNQQRVEVVAVNPVTAFQIGLQMAHRAMAVLILFGVSLVAWRARGWSSRFSVPGAGSNLKVGLQRLAVAWLGLILIQVALGAWTIWSNKAADVATAHVMVGALSLVTGALWLIISFRSPVTQSGFESISADARGMGATGFETRMAAAAGE